MFIICNKYFDKDRLNKLFVLLPIMLSVLQCVPAQKLQIQRLQRRFMWKHMDNSMDNIMDGVLSGARAFKDMIGGILPAHQLSSTTHTYRGAVDNLPTSTVRVRYIVRQPFTSTHTKYRYPSKISTNFTEPKEYLVSTTDNTKGLRAQANRFIAQNKFQTSEVDTKEKIVSTLKKSTKKNEKKISFDHSNDIIVGKPNDNWKPIIKSQLQQKKYTSLNVSPSLHTTIFNEILPEPQMLYRSSTIPTTYEVTEHVQEATILYENKQAYEKNGGFIPIISQYDPKSQSSELKKGAEHNISDKYFIKNNIQNIKNKTRTVKSFHQRNPQISWIPYANSSNDINAIQKDPTISKTSENKLPVTARDSQLLHTPDTTSDPLQKSQEFYTHKPEKLRNYVPHNTTIHKTLHKLKNITQRGSIKYGDKLTNI